jgi:putative methyltransferase
MNVYAAIVKALHTSGLIQLIAHYLRRTHDVSYEAFYSNLVDQWAVRTWWYQRLAAHFQAFLLKDDATEFMSVEELPSYPHPVTPFQWLQILVCLRLDTFFEELSQYLLVKYPHIENLASLLCYQKAMVITPSYDRRCGETFLTDLDWPSYFRAPTGDPAPDPIPGSGGTVRVADTEGTDGVNMFPLDWFARQGEDRWCAWIGRVILDYSCASRGIFQDIALDSTAIAAVSARK